MGGKPEDTPRRVLGGTLTITPLLTCLLGNTRHKARWVKKVTHSFLWAWSLVSGRPDALTHVRSPSDASPRRLSRIQVLLCGSRSKNFPMKSKRPKQGLSPCLGPNEHQKPPLCRGKEKPTGVRDRTTACELFPPI